jgi:glucose-1-phosphate thymidylyltransferase
MKGIILAGGHGTRLYPTTKTVSKQLLPVYDKPAIYYPLSILMLAGLRDILIISTPTDLPMIEDHLGDGSDLGIKLSYLVQDKPEGIAQAFILAEEFIDKQSCCLILGDNIFYGHELPKLIGEETSITEGATIFAYHVQDPERYGIVEFDASGKVIDIVEKPKVPKSHWAVTGLYFYDHNVVEYAKSLKPSARGELEITDLNKIYLQNNTLKAKSLSRGVAWLDIGTHESLLMSSTFVHAVEQRQGLKIGCIEEVAFQKGYITKSELEVLAEKYPNSSYGTYLRNLIKFPF